MTLILKGKGPSIKPQSKSISLSRKPRYIRKANDAYLPDYQDSGDAFNGNDNIDNQITPYTSAEERKDKAKKKETKKEINRSTIYRPRELNRSGLLTYLQPKKEKTLISSDLARLPSGEHPLSSAPYLHQWRPKLKLVTGLERSS